MQNTLSQNTIVYWLFVIGARTLLLSRCVFSEQTNLSALAHTAHLALRPPAPSCRAGDRIAQAEVPSSPWPRRSSGGCLVLPGKKRKEKG